MIDKEIMTKEQLLEVAKREEIKTRSIEYGEAKRIIQTFDKINDLIAKPILEAKSIRIKALVCSNKCSSCTSKTCKSNLLSCFNELRRDARTVYYEHTDGFLENNVSMSEIKKYQ